MGNKRLDEGFQKSFYAAVATQHFQSYAKLLSELRIAFFLKEIESFAVLFVLGVAGQLLKYSLLN